MKNPLDIFAELMTTRDTADEMVRLGFYDIPPSHSTICRWCREGRLEGAQKIGQGPTSAWLIPRRALLTFIVPKLGPPFITPRPRPDDEEIAAYPPGEIPY